MKRLKEKLSARRQAGVSLNLINYLLIGIGTIIAIVLVFTTYQTANSFDSLTATTAEYLTTQQTSGMISSITKSRAEDCRAFVETGEIPYTHSYVGQTEAASAQIASDALFSRLQEGLVDESTLAESSQSILIVIRAYRQMTETELHAMRLRAAAAPMPLAAFPDAIQAVSLTEEEEKLTNEEKISAALRLIDAEEYTEAAARLSTAVDDSHRQATEEAKVLADQSSARIGNITERQKILVVMFIVIAVLALILNRYMIIRPIQKSVANLDNREKIPVRGSYEMRHLAQVYNDVLQDNEEKREALSYTATHDALTGVYNRAAFDKAYKLYGNGPIGIMIVDVDQFKQFNDQYGHDVGDLVLQEVAAALKRNFRADDHISRIGGDEFCVILLNAKQEQALLAQEKINVINMELAHPKEGLPAISISAGAAFWDRAQPEHDLFKDADISLLKIKQEGRSACGVHP